MDDLENLTEEQLGDLPIEHWEEVRAELIRRITELRRECEMLGQGILEEMARLLAPRQPCLPCHAQARCWS